MKESMQAMCLFLPDSLRRELDVQAEREGMRSRAAIVRRACLEYLRVNRASDEDKEGANRE